jgi:phosphatidylinositol alpha-1,6-mannosyltransferase
MAHSVEVRVPFVDVELFRALAPLLVSQRPPTKADLASALSNPLPRHIADRPKTGFATPVRQWLASEHHPRRGKRGLRDWGLRVLNLPPKRFKALVLLTDGFGGKGGIAKFNRDLLTALARMPNCSEVVGLPRLVSEDPHDIPPRITFVSASARGKLAYIRVALRELLKRRFDIVISGHLNIAPLGLLLAKIVRARSAVIVHGIDAWKPHRNLLVRLCVPRFDRIVSVSRTTLDRLSQWARIDLGRTQILPNCVDIASFGSGPKPTDLLRRFCIEGRTVVMTVARLAAGERYKGIDEVIEALPEISAHAPNVVYVICGDGDDRARLERKVTSLNLRERVIFTGYIPEADKALYYRLADVFVLASHGEGFGIVLLEAMACGIPVVGSCIDGGREALLDGELGIVVDPRNQAELIAGILQALSKEKAVPERLRYFSVSEYEERVRAITTDLLEASA